MSKDSETIAVYDSRAADYAAMTPSGAENMQLNRFIAALNKGDNVLDLGCGPGAAAARMRDAGLSVIAMDASPAMVKLAKEQFDLTVKQATFDEIEGLHIYDGIWASFSLLHAKKSDFPRYLSALHRSLRPNGYFYIGMKLGTGEHRDDIGRFYAYYNEDELTSHLEKAGFKIEDRSLSSGVGLDGKDAPWIMISAHA